MEPLLKEIEKWQKKNRERREAGVFIVEGIKMFREIPKDRLLHVLFSESFSKAQEKLVKKTQEESGGKYTVSVISDRSFEKISDTQTPQGVLAVVKGFDHSADEILSAENGLFMFLENLQDPGNPGTVFRSAEAAGADGIILSEGCVDVYNPKVIRSTMGAFLRMKFAVVPDLLKVMEDVRKRGGSVYAAHLKDSVSYDEKDYRNMTAFLIGNESRGLSDEVTEAADSCIKIPMAGKVESLNAAMAATILLFEAARQRRVG